MRQFDVDIDIGTTIDRGAYGIRGFVYNEKTEKTSPHPSAVYLEDVPLDRLTGLSAIDYKYGDLAGFYKVDLLNNKSYVMFKSKDEILEYMHKPVDWNNFMREDLVKKLPHIGNHFDVVQMVKPKSIHDLADVLALIRPGKSHLLDYYMEDKLSTRINLYREPINEQNYFKKAHAISYAVMIVTVMNKLVEGEFVWR